MSRVVTRAVAAGAREEQNTGGNAAHSGLAGVARATEPCLEAPRVGAQRTRGVGQRATGDRAAMRVEVATM